MSNCLDGRPMSKNAPLALELIDTIIDYLQFDKASLAACSLVCKTWTSRSTLHLFSDVSIDKWNHERILALPQPSPRIIGLVRRLLILLLNARQFKNLNSRVDKFSSVTVLAFFNTVFPSFDDVAQLVCTFPKLEVLSLNGCIRRTDGRRKGVAKGRCPPSGLHTLNVRLSRISWLLKWFIKEGIPPLSTVRLHDIPVDELPYVVPALEQLGDSLEFLELDLGLDYAVPNIQVLGIHLSCYRQLRSFTLLNGHPKILYGLLKSLEPGSMLESVTLSLLPSYLPPADDWSDLDKFLSDPGAGGPRPQFIIRFIPTVLTHPELEIEEIEKHLPLCSARGSLRVIADFGLFMQQIQGFITQKWKDPTLGEPRKGALGTAA